MLPTKHPAPRSGWRQWTPKDADAWVAPETVPPRSGPASAPAPETAVAPPPAEWASAEFRIMATTATVRLPAANANEIESVVDIFTKVDDLANEWRPGTPLHAINAGAGREPVAAPAELLALLAKGLRLAETTHGRFDPSWAALWGLWDFKRPVVPDPQAAALRAASVDFRQILVDPEAGTVSLPDPAMRLGLGGLAKGHALDLAAARLVDAGVQDFLLTAGGQVLAHGAAGDRPWRVGVRDPRGSPADHFGWLPATDASVSTSGDYEHFFEVDGIRYHHILDLCTGMPAAGVRSATVRAPDATTADALSTALVALGVEHGMGLVAQMDDVDAVMVDDAGSVFITDSLLPEFRMVHPPAP
jgi:FAD:protein FMN transferase